MIVVSARPADRAAVSRIKSIRDLADPSLRGRIGISHPGFGTASGQIAALYLLWGEAKTDAFLRSLRANGVLLLGGNSVVADQTAAGSLLAGLTDNDDIANAKADGGAVEGVLPDQDGDGTLLIPTTIALVRGAPHEEAAKKLIDFLTTTQTEKRLLDAHFLAFSARGPETQVKSMQVDYVEVAHQMRSAIARSLDILQDRGQINAPTPAPLPAHR
jgi:iron(III) transport system substrate-binding protein